jgi:hypothetical protein
MEGLRRFNLHLDMDGLLADFDKGFMDMCGSTIPMREYEDEDYAWELIKKAKDFWLNLLPMPGAIAFWEKLWSQDLSLCILTSPSTHDTDRAILQKRQWVDKWLGKHVPIFYRRAKYKAQLASPDAILIDDWLPNIQGWEMAGGVAIHHLNFSATEKYLEYYAQIKDDIRSHIRK